MMRLSRVDFALLIGAVALATASLLFAAQLKQDALTLHSIKKARASAQASAPVTPLGHHSSLELWLQRHESFSNALSTLKEFPAGSFEQVEIRSVALSSRVSVSLRADPTATFPDQSKHPSWLRRMDNSVLFHGFCPSNSEDKP